MAFMLLLAVAAWVDAAVRRAGPTGHSACSRDCGLRQTRRVPGGGRDQRTTDSPTPDSAAPPQPHRPRSSCQPSTRRRPDDQASRRMPVRGPEPRVGPRGGPRHGSSTCSSRMPGKQRESEVSRWPHPRHGGSANLQAARPAGLSRAAASAQQGLPKSACLDWGACWRRSRRRASGAG